jgi:hypothetical protein
LEPINPAPPVTIVFKSEPSFQSRAETARGGFPRGVRFQPSYLPSSSSDILAICN